MEIVSREETWDSFWGKLLRIDFFEGQWDRYRQVADQRAEWLENTFGLDKRRPILSLACGEGGVELALARRGFRVTGVDRSTTFVHYAREQAAKEGLENTTFLTNDLTNERSLANLPTGFGLVCCFDTFGLLTPENEQKLVQRMAQCLSRDGKLLVDCPQREAIKPSRSWWPVRDGHLLINSLWDKNTGMQQQEPLFIEPDGTRVTLKDPYDPTREAHTGVPRLVYKPDDLTRMLQYSGLPAQAVRHQRGGYYMVVAQQEVN